MSLLLLYIVPMAVLALGVCRSPALADATFRSRVGIGLWGGCIFLLPTVHEIAGNMPELPFLFRPPRWCGAGRGPDGPHART